MIDITAENHEVEFEYIREALRAGIYSYAAVDVEMSGVESDPIRWVVGPQDRYLKAKAAAEKYEVLQVGFSFTRLDPDAAPGRRRVAHKACTIVASLGGKRAARDDVVFSLESLLFLRKHGFDVNENLDNGVPPEEVAGLVRDVVMCLPLVGFGITQDLIFLASHFLFPLPDTVDGFARALRGATRLVVDTRMLNDGARHQPGLEKLHAQLKGDPAGQFAVAATADGILPGVCDEDLAAFHRAGWDAKVTSEAFLMQCKKLGGFDRFFARRAPPPAAARPAAAGGGRPHASGSTPAPGVGGRPKPAVIRESAPRLEKNAAALSLEKTAGLEGGPSLAKSVALEGASLEKHAARPEPALLQLAGASDRENASVLENNAPRPEATPGLEEHASRLEPAPRLLGRAPSPETHAPPRIGSGLSERASTFASVVRSQYAYACGRLPFHWAPPEFAIDLAAERQYEPWARDYFVNTVVLKTESLQDLRTVKRHFMATMCSEVSPGYHWLRWEDEKRGKYFPPPAFYALKNFWRGDTSVDVLIARGVVDQSLADKLEGPAAAVVVYTPDEWLYKFHKMGPWTPPVMRLPAGGEVDDDTDSDSLARRAVEDSRPKFASWEELQEKNAAFEHWLQTAPCDKDEEDEEDEEEEEESYDDGGGEPLASSVVSRVDQDGPPGVDPDSCGERPSKKRRL